MPFRELTEEELKAYSPEQLEAAETISDEDFYRTSSIAPRFRELTEEELKGYSPEEVQNAREISEDQLPKPGITQRLPKLLGGAYSYLGKAAGLPGLEQVGEDLKKSEGYMGIMKSLYGEYADIPTQFIKGLSWNYVPAVETAADASMTRKAITTASYLLGFGFGVLPITKVARAAIPSVGVVSALARGGLTGAVYGLGAKPEEHETRLVNLFKYGAMFSAFEGGAAVLERMAAHIPAVGRMFEKISKGEILTKGEKTMRAAVELGRTSALGGGAGLLQPAESLEERLQHMFIGFGSFFLAGVGSSVITKGMRSVRTEEAKIPQGFRFDIEGALKSPEITPEKRLTALNIVVNRLIRTNPQNWEIVEAFRYYGKERIDKNEIIDFEGFDKAIDKSKFIAMKELERREAIPKKKIGEVLQVEDIPADMSRIERSWAELLKEKEPMLYTAEDKVIAAKYGIHPKKPISIEVVPGTTSKETIWKEPFKALSGKPIEHIKADEVAQIRAKITYLSMTGDIEPGKVFTSGKIPITISEKVPQGEVVSHEIKNIETRNLVRTLIGLARKGEEGIVDFKEMLSKGDVNLRLLHGTYPYLTRDVIDFLNKANPATQKPLPIAPKIIGSISADKFGDLVFTNMQRQATTQLMQEFKKGTQLDAIHEVLTMQELRLERFLPKEATAERDILKSTFASFRERVNDLYNTFTGEPFGGKLMYHQVREIGKQIYNEGHTTIESFRKRFVEYYGTDGVTLELPKILRAFREISMEAQEPLKETREGYVVNDHTSGTPEHDLFLRQEYSLKKRFGDMKDKFMGFMNKNVEAASDVFKSVPNKEREVLVNDMAKQLGFFPYIKYKIGQWVKVPVWDKDISFVTKGLRKVSQRTAEIQHEFLRKNEFLKRYKPSQDMTDAIYKTTVKQTPVGWERLNPKERAMVERVFENTKWMMEQFKKELKENASAFDAIAKAQGFEKTEDYINDYISKHTRAFYFPLVRGEGDYVVYARDESKKIIWAENFESVKAAKKRTTELMEQLPNAKLGMFDVKRKYGFKFPELLEMIHDLPRMRNLLKSKDIAPETVKELEDVLHGAYLEIWARGRLAPREGIKGFSTDIHYVIERYAETFPRSFVRRARARHIQDLIDNVPEEKQIYAKNLVDYYLGRRDYEGNMNFLVRNIIYNWNLSLKPSFALLNLSQRGATTVWRAIKEAGDGGGGIVLRSQLKELNFYKEFVRGRLKGETTRNLIKSSNIFSATDKDVIIKLHDRGELESLRNLEIIGKSKIGRFLNVLSTASEKSNRIHSALTAVEIGTRRGLRGEVLFDYVVDFISKTQWMYGKENRPIIGRGWRAMGFVFKSYVFNDLNFLKDLYPHKKAFAGAISTRLALGGLGGIYGMGFIVEAVDFAMKKIVGVHDWELSKRETLRTLKNKYGEATINTLTKGLPSMVGVEGSITFGSPELFDIAGIPLVKGSIYNIKLALAEEGVDWENFIRRNSPTMVKHAMGFSTETIFGKPKITREDIKRLPLELRKRALEVYNEMPKKMDEKEKFLYALGFTTATPSEFYAALMAIKESARMVRKYKAGIHRQIGRAIEERRHGDVKKLIDDARARGMRLDITAIRRQVRGYREAEEQEREMEGRE